MFVGLIRKVTWPNGVQLRCSPGPNATALGDVRAGDKSTQTTVVVQTVTPSPDARRTVGGILFPTAAAEMRRQAVTLIVSTGV
ncbi:hypothetical protein AVEN_52092-1 [Araneus ventricosus]|uniref:Uncharacterized protein n=1 Tax=Araneus ventricosus TaxID=182803 RepID=A0A4Y2UDF7_ARAVE|nr:hypothetical protein AVEN_52092-1 [Araneus ventricosus]